jgi:hypothetical protein
VTGVATVTPARAGAYAATLAGLRAGHATREALARALALDLATVEQALRDLKRDRVIRWLRVPGTRARWHLTGVKPP